MAIYNDIIDFKTDNGSNNKSAGVMDMDFINMIICSRIDKRTTFNDMNYQIMSDRFMNMNINSRNEILSNIGEQAYIGGNSSFITGEAQSPSYAKGMNYIDEFARYTYTDERDGENSTRSSLWNESGSSYNKVVNLYPDELNAGMILNKWKCTNENSILTKTKKLFSNYKINTLISRFGTYTDSTGSQVLSNGDSVTQYGMSHGRNLLKKSAENGNDTERYTIHGYNNPYCRVWTHHYQYDSLSKLIRPFGIYNDEGYREEIPTLDEMHRWPGFNVDKPEEGQKSMGNGWKNENVGWKESVLNRNGFVNIAPKYMGGGDMNLHTKNCMFSIENLAWRGYDPYSFENALSWEQRGPLGGRIMWFPPYGLSFNETTQTNWQSNTFIGRGEDVYTYVNTTRSGTLSFIMLTDHPSVIDYANWYDNPDLTDNDILRFFAGCDAGKPSGASNGGDGGEDGSGDGGDSDSLFSKVKPVPLTDEYIQKVDEEVLHIEPVPEPKKEPEPEIKEDIKEVVFFVFYPNNYSGTYDLPSNRSGNNTVHAIAYLLGGKGCNKKDASIENKDGGIDVGILFDLFHVQGNGYEMSSNNGISNQSSQESGGDYIIGSSVTWTDASRKHLSKYQYDSRRKWYYRIDGLYEVPVKSDGKTENSGFYRNTYDQKLYRSNNYSDNYSFNLNYDGDRVKSQAVDLISGNTDNVYSLTEVAVAIAKGSSEGNVFKYPGIYQSFYNNNLSQNQKDRIDDLIEILNGYKLIDVEAVGYSNIHGANKSDKINDTRNDYLALNRAWTVVNWLTDCGVIDKSKTPVKVDKVPSHQIEGEQNNKSARDLQNASSLAAKLYRSAKITLRFSLNETEPLSVMRPEGEVNVDDVWDKYPGFKFIRKNEEGKDVYRNEKEANEIWVERKEGELVKAVDGGIKARKTGDNPYLGTIKGQYSTDDVFNGPTYYEFKAGATTKKYTETDNKIRFDKEYHFFKELKSSNPIVFKKLTDKLKYFDPAFHSITPEGFTQRLTFLNQCTRQGNTISPNNMSIKNASNLAFGRPPFCVLRIGDFYYQTILIDSINIDYSVSGGLQWDLNPEGTGVQPMLAQVNISFKFIGGGDLGGPIRRLQNAMTFNYYANSRLHDNRADRIKYNWSPETNGALDYGVDKDESSAYTTEMATK